MGALKKILLILLIAFLALLALRIVLPTLIWMMKLVLTLALLVVIGFAIAYLWRKFKSA